MSRTEKTIFTNMCMVYDDNGNVLVQNRLNPDWPGITFPGGHVDAGESFTDAVIREVFEETSPPSVIMTGNIGRLVFLYVSVQLRIRTVALFFKGCHNESHRGLKLSFVQINRLRRPSSYPGTHIPQSQSE